MSDTKILATQITSPEGQAVFHRPDAGSYQIKVLAPGFAAETIDVSSQSELTVKLRLAPASETVVVSATRTPVPGEAAGADVDTLTGAQLTTMQPVAANDALRFLPGAVINTAGQRGGLSSLFVRGGESNYNKVIVDGVTINEPGGTFDFGTLSLAQGDRLEFVRGAQSTLYGSDAMTSLIQVWTRAGNTPTPELRHRSRWRQPQHRQRSRLVSRRSRTLRLQRLRRSIQHQRFWRQRRVLRFARRRERRRPTQRLRFVARSLPSLQQSHRRSRRMELQRIRSAGLRRWLLSTSDTVAARSERLVATEQHSR